MGDLPISHSDLQVLCRYSSRPQLAQSSVQQPSLGVLIALSCLARGRIELPVLGTQGALAALSSVGAV